MSSLLYAASRQRVEVGVALLAVVGVLRHAEPDSVDAEVGGEAPLGLADQLWMCVYVHCTCAALKWTVWTCSV